jgi:large subunit ribosomal protein L6
MRKEVTETIEIPEGMEAILENKILTVKKGENKLERKFSGFEVKKEGKNIVLHYSEATKKTKKLIKTAAAHIRNMISGLGEKYVYKLQVCFVHFPISIELKQGELLIKNFLGEKVPRKAKLLAGAEVKLDKDIITITSFDKDIAGQTAANIETASRIRNRDRRVFQDGIFITQKSKGKTR